MTMEKNVFDHDIFRRNNIDNDDDLKEFIDNLPKITNESIDTIDKDTMAIMLWMAISTGLNRDQKLGLSLAMAMFSKIIPSASLDSGMETIEYITAILDNRDIVEIITSIGVIVNGEI